MECVICLWVLLRCSSHPQHISAQPGQAGVCNATCSPPLFTRECSCLGSSQKQSSAHLKSARGGERTTSPAVCFTDNCPWSSADQFTMVLASSCQFLLCLWALGFSASEGKFMIIKTHFIFPFSFFYCNLLLHFLLSCNALTTNVVTDLYVVSITSALHKEKYSSAASPLCMPSKFIQNLCGCYRSGFFFCAQ